MNRRTFLTGLMAAFAVIGPATAKTNQQTSGQSRRLHEVIIIRSEFTPAILQVQPGDRVRWTNNDIVPHTATALDESWDTGEIEAGASAMIAIESGHGGDYFCQYHPSMRASLGNI
ncbi:MAG: copper-binding protein [Alphaproteobacteria bacterium]|jgi:plastocyanin|nr:copper-binding protein [Alphaproteobacteria bacterium]